MHWPCFFYIRGALHTFSALTRRVDPLSTLRVAHYGRRLGVFFLEITRRSPFFPSSHFANGEAVLSRSQSFFLSPIRPLAFSLFCARVADLLFLRA